MKEIKKKIFPLFFHCNSQIHSPFRGISCYYQFNLSLCSLRRLPGALNTYLVHLAHVASTNNASGSENMFPFHEILCILFTPDVKLLRHSWWYYYYVDKVKK